MGFEAKFVSQNWSWYCKTEGSIPIPIPIPGSCQSSIPVPIPIPESCGWSIPIPIPGKSRFQYQYQYRPPRSIPQYQYQVLLVSAHYPTQCIIRRPSIIYLPSLCFLSTFVQSSDPKTKDPRVFGRLHWTLYKTIGFL